jgi:acetamidase/formamidase
MAGTFRGLPYDSEDHKFRPEQDDLEVVRAAVPLSHFQAQLCSTSDNGRISTMPPGIYGNLDNKELIAGTILYLPVHVKRTYFQYRTDMLLKRWQVCECTKQH